MRIVLTGGGSGGHIYPLIAVARELRRIAEEERILDMELYYFGTGGATMAAFAAEEIPVARLHAGKMRRYWSVKNFLDYFVAALGIAETFWHMFVVMPDVVFSKGAYGSFSTVLMARLFRIPVVIHESDAVPGRVNQWAGKFATRIAISFTHAARFFPTDRTALTGLPIRTAVLGGEREAAHDFLGIFSSRPVLLVLGGSQGSQTINDTILDSLELLLTKYEVIHQTGLEHFTDIKLQSQTLLTEATSPYYHVSAFLDEQSLAMAYTLADLAVSRSGSGIFELAARGIPSILIPLVSAAQDHQRLNAYEYAADGAAAIIEEANLTPSVLAHEISQILENRETQERMKQAAKKFARVNAAEEIARELLTIGLH